MENQPSRRSVLSVTSGAIVTGLAGCLTGSNGGDQSGDDGHSDSEESHQEEESSHSGGNNTSGSGTEVAMVTNDSGTHFEPHVVQIQPGESVTWTLKSGSHTTTAYTEANDRPQRIPKGSEAWDSGTLSEEGATFEHTFETEGVYDYCCAPHEDGGMLGSIVVGDPDLSNQPGMAEPQSSLPDGAQKKIRELNEMVQNGGGSGDSGHDDSH